MPDSYHVRLAISQYGDQFRAELFTEDLGDTEGDLLPASWEILDEWLPYLGRGRPASPRTRRARSARSCSRPSGQGRERQEVDGDPGAARRQGRPLRLLIDATTDAVRDLPYGLLCEPHDDYFLLRPPRRRPGHPVRAHPPPLHTAAPLHLGQAGPRAAGRRGAPVAAMCRPFDCAQRVV